MAIIKFMLGNLKRRKSYSIIISILVFLTGLILTVTISTVISAYQAFDNSFENMEGPHVFYLFSKDNFKPEFQQWYEKQQDIESVKLRYAKSINGGVLEKNGKTLRDSIDYRLFEYTPSDNMRLIDSYYAINRELSKGEIYIPYLFKDEYKLAVGENVDFVFGTKKMSFKIVGFIEDPVSGGAMDSSKYLFISSADYNTFSELGSDKVYEQIQMRVHFSSYDIVSASNIGKKFMDEYGANVSFSKTYSIMKNTILTLPNICLIVVITFAAFLCIITITILRYAILATIEVEYLNIGIVKALGFTPIMVRISMTGQYALLAFVSSILSLIAGAVITPVIGRIMLQSSGLYFSGSLSITVGLLILLALVIIISLVSYVTSWRTKKLTPIRAIANGLSPIYFSSRLNVKLERIRFLPFNIRMSLKQVVSKSKRYILLITISAMLSFSLIFSLGLMNLFNSEKAINMLGMETPDIEIDTSTKSEVATLITNIKNDYAVEWTTLRCWRQLEIDGEQTIVLIKDDFETTGELMNVKGRHPKNDNEVAISNLLKTRYGKDIGQYLSIKDKNGNTHQFIITGVFQTVEEGGILARITEDGMKVLEPKFELNEGYIKLKDHSNVDNVIREMKSRYTGYEEISNERKQSLEQINTIKAVFGAISKLVFALTIIIIGFITLLVMKITIYSETNEMGIYKALGFSSARIRLQLILRFVIITLLGGLIGAILEAFIGSKVFSMALGFVGIARINIDFDLLITLISIGIICVIALLSAYASSGNTKKLSAYTLIKE